MAYQKLCQGTSVFAAMMLFVLLLTALATAEANEKLIYKFPGGVKGSYPSGSLLADSAGNFYGTTSAGGSHNMGTVFELSPKENGKGWIEKVLYSFADSADGSPVSGVIADSNGNLYGETAEGGAQGEGTVYELSPSEKGWTKTILYSFVDQTTGISPVGGLVLDAKGNIYGTTPQGGVPFGLGTVFQLTPGENGWTEKVILAFGRNRDGGLPFAGPVIDGQGNLYGTTFAGYGEGTVYELTPQPDGSWKRVVLHRFTGKKDGGNPSGSLILDAAGNLYGTTQAGGAPINQNGCDFGCGTVFELSPGPTKWELTVLYAFAGGQDGKQPDAAVAFDESGNLYGTTELGGGTGCNLNFGCGTAFELTPSAKAPWTETVLHRFENQPDGLIPQGALIPDTEGNWYGTTGTGGPKDLGTVFRLTP